MSVVGGGGKSSLLFALAEELPGRVVLTTTTRIFAAQWRQAAESCSTDEADWESRLDAFTKSLLLVAGVEGDRAVGVPPDLPGRILARHGVDWVVVEADGSRMLPVKAPAAHEPVVPSDTTLLVPVVGVDAFSAPIAEVAHRPERVCAISGLTQRERLTPRALATLMTSPDGGLKCLPPRARAVVLINKVESPEQAELARSAAHLMLDEPRVDRVILGALAAPIPHPFEIVAR